MGHHILGFVARLEPLREVATHRNWVVVPLTQGFGFLPVTKQIVGSDSSPLFNEFERLTAPLNEWAVEVSLQFPLAYIETEYFGGVGAQSAVNWESGRIVYGPVVSKSDWVDGRLVSVPLPVSAINQAVQLIGVVRGEDLDEFAALGLDRHRSNEYWLCSNVNGSVGIWNQPGTSEA